MNLDELQRLAEGATPGKWHATQATVFALHGEPPRNRFSANMQAGRRDDAPWAELVANAEFCAAMSPDTAKKLIAVARAAQALEFLMQRDGCVLPCAEFAGLRTALEELK